MADNFTANPGAGGDTFAADDVSGVKYPYSKLDIGGDGASSPVTAGNPLPVTGPLTDAQLRATPVPVSGTVATGGLTDAQLRAAPVDQNLLADPVAYWPSYGAPTTDTQREAGIDTGGALSVRGAVLTDEGTFRANFANTSLSVAIGSVTIAGAVVTGAGFRTTQVHIRDYFKLDADAESAWLQIESIDSDTQLTLVSAYVGGSSGAASRALVRPITGAGGSITVASGQCTIASGTTSGSVSAIIRAIDYAPVIYRGRHSISQRIANQSVRIGFAETTTGAPRWFARFRFEGTVNTVGVCETGRNPTGAPSVAETQSTTFTLPNGRTTAIAADYRVEMLTESVRFYVDGVLVAEHSLVMPAAYDELSTGVLIQNTGVPGGTTTVVSDYVTAKNHNKLEIGVMSDAEKILAAQPPMAAYNFTQAGVIVINTDLLIIDCAQLRSLSIQAVSVGTTGVITPSWSNDGVTFVNSSIMTTLGVAAATFNAAGLWNVNVNARYFRLRLTTATTAGTTTLVVNGSQFPTSQPVAQPIAGAVTVSGSLTSAGTTTSTPATPTASNINSAATTNAAFIKASAGTLYALNASNAGAGAAYVKFYNQTTAPTVGTSVPVIVLTVAPSGTAMLDLGALGHRFTTGIAIAITGGAADSDTTAVAVNQVKVLTSYI